MDNEAINIIKVIINSGALETKNNEILLKKINIFVGANNSGKSRVIRTIIDRNKVKYENYFSYFADKLSELLTNYEKYFNVLTNKNVKGRHFSEFKKNLDYLKKIKGFQPQSSLVNDLNNSKEYFSNAISQNNITYQRSDRIKIEGLVKELVSFIKEKEKGEIDRNFYYIPTLRGLRTLDFVDLAKEKIEDAFVKAQLERSISFSKDFYKGRTLKDYWYNGKNLVAGNNYSYDAFEKSLGINIFTGIDLYNELMEMMLGTDKERKSIQEWCKYLEIHYFENPIDITPNIKENVVKIKLGNQIERSIHDLGDGLQSIIIITFIMFKCKDKNTIIAIEEPELFLHPGMQRILIQNMLNDEFSNLQFLLTTHSNHFLEVLYESNDKVNIYNCERVDNSIILNDILNTREGEILTNLGVKASSLFLSNGIIMVEGISDIIYFRKFLNLYMKKNNLKVFIEDKHFTFIESSGNNIVHWDFIGGDITSEKIFRNLFIIVDGDGLDIDELEQKEELSEKENRLLMINNLNYSYVLRRRETENLLPWQPIKKYIIEKESHYGGQLRIINEDLIPDVSDTKYKKNYLGKFIQKQLKNLAEEVSNKKVYKYNSESGTISNKLEFSRGVCKHITDYEQLTDEAKIITEHLYNFILEVNK